MDPECEGPEEVYYALRIPNEKFGPEPNITIIPPARLGKEYPKTFGHYHEQGEPETYRFLYGSGHILIQKRSAGGGIEDVQLIAGQVGDTVEVPEGYGHALINTSDDVLVTADWEAETAGHIYDEIERKQGMTYYVVEEKGEIKTVQNANYNNVPEITVVKEGTLK